MLISISYFSAYSDRVHFDGIALRIGEEAGEEKVTPTREQQN
jgi:hypothetical protein